MTLNLEDLERVVNLSGAHVKDHLVWPRAEIAALIARLREAEQERDEARWAAGIVGDVAREASNGWQDASAELHATEVRLREAEAVIESLEALLPKWWESRAYNAEAFTTGGIGMMREIDYHGDVERTLAAYKPTNQEGES